MNGGGGADPTPSFAYSEAFERVFPFYLTIGMTYDQFWRDDPELVKYYRDAFSLKQQLREQEIWLQGAYMAEAIGAVFSSKKNKVRYPQQPHGYLGKPKMSKKDRKIEEEKADARAKTSMEMWMVNINRKFEKKGGEGNGS